MAISRGLVSSYYKEENYSVLLEVGMITVHTGFLKPCEFLTIKFYFSIVYIKLFFKRWGNAIKASYVYK